MDTTWTYGDTAITFSWATVGFQAMGYGFDLSGLTAEFGYYRSDTDKTQTTSSAQGSAVVPNGTWKECPIISGNPAFTFTRGHAGYNVCVWGQVTNASGFEDGFSKAEFWFTVPARPSYSVSFNANGGNGAPSAQTKWHAETLTLSPEKPTRSGYTFLRWNTKANGSGTSYSPGATYTANAALTLYAIWSLNHRKPTISSITCSRCTSDGTASSSGTYCKATVTWSTDGPCKTIKAEYSTNGTSYSGATSASSTATSGTTSIVFGGGALATTSSYVIRMTVTDAAGASSSIGGGIAPSVPFLLFRDDGSGIDVGKQIQSFQTGGNWLAAKGGKNAALRMPDNATNGGRFDAWLAAVGLNGVTTAIGTLGSGDITLISLLSGRTTNGVDHRATWRGDSGDLLVGTEHVTSTISQANLIRLLRTYDSGNIPAGSKASNGSQGFWRLNVIGGIAVVTCLFYWSAVAWGVGYLTEASTLVPDWARPANKIQAAMNSNGGPSDNMALVVETNGNVSVHHNAGNVTNPAWMGGTISWAITR